MLFILECESMYESFEWGQFGIWKKSLSDWWNSPKFWIWVGCIFKSQIWSKTFILYYENLKLILVLCGVVITHCHHPLSILAVGEAFWIWMPKRSQRGLEKPMDKEDKKSVYWMVDHAPCSFPDVNDGSWVWSTLCIMLPLSHRKIMFISHSISFCFCFFSLANRNAHPKYKLGFFFFFFIL